MQPPQFPNQGVAQQPVFAPPAQTYAQPPVQAQVPPQQAPQGYPGPAVPMQAQGYAQSQAYQSQAYQSQVPVQYAQAPGQAPPVQAQAYAPAPAPAAQGVDLSALQARIMSATVGGSRHPQLPVGTYVVEIVRYETPQNSPGLQVREYTLKWADEEGVSNGARVGGTYARLQPLNGGGKNAAGSRSMQEGITLGLCLAVEGYPDKDSAAAAGALPDIARKAAELMAWHQGMPIQMPEGGPHVGRLVTIRVYPGKNVDPKTGKPYTSEAFSPYSAG